LHFIVNNLGGRESPFLSVSTFSWLLREVITTIPLTSYQSNLYHHSPIKRISNVLILDYRGLRIKKIEAILFYDFIGRILKENLSWTRKESNSSDAERFLHV